MGAQGDRAFLIYDELHAENFGRFHTVEQAIAGVERLADQTWDQLPNKAPCTSWRTCGRRYVVEEMNDANEPWITLGTAPICEVSESGVTGIKPMSGDTPG